MKDFEGQRRFNPAKLPTLGEPLKTLDITPQISQVYREKMRMDEGYIRSIEQNERQELNNIDIATANAERKQAKIDADLNALVAFAPTLLNLGQQRIEQKIKEDEIQGKMKAFDMDFSNLTELPYYQEQMAELEAIRNDHDANAAEAFQRTKNYELARVYKSLNGAERVGFAKTFLAEKQAEWPAYLSEQMTSNDDLQITVGGDTFTPSEAEGAAQNAAAAKAIYRQYILDNGMSGMNDFFMEEHFTGGNNGARTQTQKILAKRNKHDAKMHAENNYIRITAENSAEAKSNPAMANGIKVLNAIGLLQDKNGDPLDGFSKATKFKEHVEGLVESGVLRSQEDVENYLRNTPDPVVPGGNMLNRLQLAGGLRLKVTNRNIQDYRDYEGLKKAKWADRGGERDGILEEWKTQRAQTGQAVTLDEYLKSQRLAVQATGREDKQLADWWENDSQHGQNFQENLEKIKEMADAGHGLTPELVRAALGNTPEAEQYINIARGQVKSKSSTAGFKYSFKAASQAVKQASGFTGGVDAEVPHKQAYIISELHQEIIKEAQVLINSGDPRFADPLAAEKEATNLVLGRAVAEQGLEQNSVSGIYAPGVDKAFSNFYDQDEIKERARSASTTLNIIEQQTAKFQNDYQEYNGDLDVPGAYVDPKVLEYHANKYYNDDGSFNSKFKMPEAVKHLARLNPDKGQFEILQKLIEVNKVTDKDGNPLMIQPPPSLDPRFAEISRGGGIDEKLTRLYQNVQTGFEALRVGASSDAGFQSARIPAGYEAPLKKVSAGSELPYELVAALVQAESGFQDVRSEPNHDGSYDGGPFQTNSYYYKHTYGDIGGNADNALLQMQAVKAELAANGIGPGHPDYQDAMLAGYNAGQGTLNFKNGRFVPNATHKNYINRVRKSLLGMGDRSQLTNNATIRSTFHPDTGQGYAVEGATDYKGRPVVFSREAASAFDRMVQDSGGVVKYSDVHSAQRSQAKNASLPGASPTSNHLSGNAVDIHGASKAWIKKHGHKYGWKNLVYDGHDGHFDFK